MAGGDAASGGWRYPAPLGWRPNFIDQHGDEVEWHQGEGMIEIRYLSSGAFDDNPNRHQLEERLSRDPAALGDYLARRERDIAARAADRERAAVARANLADARRRNEETARQRGRAARAAAGSRDRFGGWIGQA